MWIFEGPLHSRGRGGVREGKMKGRDRKRKYEKKQKEWEYTSG